jgi:hypothetical protein
MNGRRIAAPVLRKETRIGIYLTTITHHVILSEAAQSAAKSKNPFYYTFLGDGSFDSLALAQDDSVF